MTWQTGDLRCVLQALLEFCTQYDAINLSRVCKTWYTMLHAELLELYNWCNLREKIIFVRPAYMYIYSGFIYINRDAKEKFFEPGLFYENLDDKIFIADRDREIVNRLPSHEIRKIFEFGINYVIYNSSIGNWRTRVMLRDNLIIFTPKYLKPTDLSINNIYYSYNCFKHDLTHSDNYYIRGKFRFMLYYTCVFQLDKFLYSSVLLKPDSNNKSIIGKYFTLTHLNLI